MFSEKFFSFYIPKRYWSSETECFFFCVETSALLKINFPSERQYDHFCNSEHIAHLWLFLSLIRSAVSTDGAPGCLESLCCQILYTKSREVWTSVSQVVFDAFSAQGICEVLVILKVVSKPLSPRFILLVSVLLGGECFVSEAVQMSTKFSSGFWKHD